MNSTLSWSLLIISALPLTTSSKTIGQDIDADNEQIKNGQGYDHNFVLNKKEEGELSFAAKIKGAGLLRPRLQAVGAFLYLLRLGKRQLGDPLRSRGDEAPGKARYKLACGA